MFQHRHGDGGRHLQIAEKLAAGFELRDPLLSNGCDYAAHRPANFDWFFGQIQREHKPGAKHCRQTRNAHVRKGRRASFEK